MIFRGAYYQAEHAGGTVVFRSPAGAVIARLASYRVEFGTVCNVRKPIETGDEWIVVDTSDGIAPGDCVEIRNEYLLARANLPVRHACRAVEVRLQGVRVDSLPSAPQLRVEPGLILTRTERLEVRRFDAREGTPPPGGVTWLLTAVAENLEVRLELSLQRESPTVQIRVVRDYRHDLRIFNESLRWEELPALAEVYRKNRKVDTGVFQRAYNVEQQGALFSDGPGRSLYLYGASNATSTVVHCAAAEFSVTSEHAFRPAPHDVAAMAARDLSRYAVARQKSAAATARQGPSVVVEAEFARPIEVRGLRLLWQRAANRAVRIAAAAQSVGGDDAWVPLLERNIPPGGLLRDEFVAERPLVTRRVRIALWPPPEEEARGIISIRDLDFLVGGAGFGLGINLDDHRDHRYWRFLDPRERRSTMGKHVLEHRSTTRRARGESAQARFQFALGQVPGIRPRIMHVPGGAQSMLLWTEHADKTCLQSHRAVYFGRSDVDSAGDAVGGFVASGIAVTKSVFRENPDNVPCTESWPARQAALDDPGFFRFCRELAGVGHEICVHAPRPRDAGPAAGPETAEYMARMFGSRTWIDHSARSVHCGMTGQGLNPDSPYSMAESWRRCGFRYFWHFASEDGAEERAGSVNVQQMRLGDWTHTPLYWSHPSETGDFISWPTVRGPADLAGYVEGGIAEVVADWGIFANHTYPAAHYVPAERSQYLVHGTAGVLESSPLFERVLAELKQRMEAGEMVSLTIARAIEYWEAIEHVKMVSSADGSILLQNLSGRDIRGFAVAIAGAAALEPALGGYARKAGKDTIVALDLRAGAALRLAMDAGPGGSPTVRLSGDGAVHAVASEST